MKKLVLLILLFFSMNIIWASGIEEKPCAPLKNGKVCYSYDIKANNKSKVKLFEAISKWATKKYGSDLFFSNVSSNKNKGSVLISSKLELLLNDDDKTFIKFKVRIDCHDNRCAMDITDIVYQYDPNEEKRFKVYPAEDVIGNNGTNNKVAIIKDPVLFCNATLFFADGLMNEVVNAIKQIR